MTNNKNWEEDYTIFGGGMLVRNDRLKSGGIVANKETRRSVEEILQKEREKNSKEMVDAILASKEGWIEEGAQKERQRICEELEGIPRIIGKDGTTTILVKDLLEAIQKINELP